MVKMTSLVFSKLLCFPLGVRAPVRRVAVGILRRARSLSYVTAVKCRTQPASRDARASKTDQDLDLLVSVS